MRTVIADKTEQEHILTCPLVGTDPYDRIGWRIVIDLLNSGVDYQIFYASHQQQDYVTFYLSV